MISLPWWIVLSLLVLWRECVCSFTAPPVIVMNE
jgi:hypothetical protein